MRERLLRILTSLKARLQTAADAERPALQQEISEMESALQALPEQNGAGSAPAPAGGEMAEIRAALAGLTTEIGTLKTANADLAKLLGEEKNAREAAQTELATQKKAAADQAVSDMLDAAVAAGKLTPEQRTAYEDKAKTYTDPAPYWDATRTALEAMKPNPALNRIQNGQKPGTGTGTEGGGKAPAPAPTPTDGVSRSARPDVLKYVMESSAAN